MEGISPPLGLGAQASLPACFGQSHFSEDSQARMPALPGVGRENLTQWLGGTISGVFHYIVLTDRRRLMRRSLDQLDNAARDPWAA